MLFREKELASIYDLDHEQIDNHVDLSSLSVEIYEKTQLLYLYWKENKTVTFFHADNTGLVHRVDFAKVSRYTWNRSVGEIREILYRKEIDGKKQAQFSISKAVSLFCKEKVEWSLTDQQYLQLLYFLYMMNYFAFPGKNVFKFLLTDSYRRSYDEGCDQGTYLHFILMNLLDHPSVLLAFCRMNDELSLYMEQLSENVVSLCSKGCHAEKIVSACGPLPSELFSSQEGQKDALTRMMESCQLYAMRGYVHDLCTNLEKNRECFLPQPLKIKPFESWKQAYIDIDYRKTFLYSDEVYQFCKQREGKAAVRDKIKFCESNGCRFLEQLIDLDLRWMELLQEEEGVLLQRWGDHTVFYALKAAIIIKTYNELTIQKRIRLTEGEGNERQPLRSALSSGNAYLDILPPTLAIRFFLLAAHAQYLYAISDDVPIAHARFLLEHLWPEQAVMELLKTALSCPHERGCRRYLLKCLSVTQQMLACLDQTEV